MMAKHFVCSMAVATLVMSAGACDDPADLPAVMDEAKLGLLVLAEISIEDVMVKFTESPSGKIVVSEVGPIGRPSYLPYFAAEFDATPLEIFLALSPDEEAPVELKIQHDELSGEEPRSLAAPDFSFRTVYEPYAADCSLSADGGWFDSVWTSWSWDWHWYYSGTASLTVTPTKSTTDVITHACNYSVDTPGGLAHELVDGTQPIGLNQYFGPGYKSYMSLYGANGSYYARAGTAWVEGTYRLGIMAP